MHDAYVKHLLDTCETFMAEEGVIYHYKEICEYEPNDNSILEADELCNR